MKPVGEPSAVREDDIWAPLRSRGWRIETDQEGSTLLYPPKAKAVEGEVPQQRSAQPEAGSGAQQQTLEQQQHIVF